MPPDENDPDAQGDEEQEQLAPLSDLTESELLDLVEYKFRAERRRDDADRIAGTVYDVGGLTDEDVEALGESELGSEVIRRRQEAVAKATEEQARLEEEARANETPEQRAEREAKNREAIEQRVGKKRTEIRQAFSELRHTPGPGPWEEKYEQLQEQIGPMEELVAVLDSSSALGAAKVAAWNAASPETRQLARQWYGIEGPFSTALDGDAYEAGVRAEAELLDWQKGELK